MDIAVPQAVLRLRHLFGVDENTVRPFRLYHANDKIFLRWRYFSSPRQAHMAALYEIRWAKVGATIEVVDVSIGKMIGCYRRGLNDIQFARGD